MIPMQMGEDDGPAEGARQRCQIDQACAGIEDESRRGITFRDRHAGCVATVRLECCSGGRCGASGPEYMDLQTISSSLR